MAGNITLLGTEAVTRAGSSMQSAANDMQRAATSIEDSLYRHRMFLDDWILRLEETLKSNIPKA